MKLTNTNITNIDIEKLRNQNYKNDPKKLFRFFHENHKLFNQIENEDYLQIRKIFMKKVIYSFNTFYGIVFLSFLVDRFLMKSLYIDKPNLLRKTAIFTQYIFLPIGAAFGVYHYMKAQESDILTQYSNKYNFTTQQYEQAIDQIQKAYNANMLQQFYKEGYQFKWNEISELKK